MSNSVWREQHYCLNLMKWGRASWTLLFFMASGAVSLVTVHQPPVLSAALGRDVIMPCELQLEDEKLMSQPVLYWWKLNKEGDDFTPLIPSQLGNDSRVNLLDNNRTSSNKSIILTNVEWADSGKFRCKLSLQTHRGGSFRKKGNATSLVLYDTVVFNVTKHSHCLLRCEVNVTQDAGFALYIFHNGDRLQNVTSAPGDTGAALPYVTLSETVPLRWPGKYECQLHLKDELIIKSVFHSNLPEVGEAEKNVTRTCSPAVPEVYPEPWLLYVALLLVPVTILLGLVTVMLMCR
ncbi:uncharacterized protein LOC115794643 [Archocentrus centrarchus]|uniref:uncharacterized protein LOC115794643 n=1 Tax=Archocentrus centrarchus TaxID=63155 RepID=UPI0011EA48DE|nr:uncharacterized protein LOC115794643 [Archocentrus centrarchus]